MVLADTGIPMLALELPGMILVLVPVILIEAAILCRRLRIPAGRSLKASALANVISTIVGIPLSWLVMLVLDFATTQGRALGIRTPIEKLGTVVLGAAWLPPYEGDLHWLIPAATAVLLLPAFLLSVLIERTVIGRLCPDRERSDVSSATWRANSASYALLFLCTIGFLVWALAFARPPDKRHGVDEAPRPESEGSSVPSADSSLPPASRNE